MSRRVPDRMIGRILNILRPAQAEPSAPRLRALRVRLGLPIAARLNFAGRQSTIRGAVLGDLSATGAFVETRLVLPEGSRLTIVVPLSAGRDREVLELSGEVRWTRHGHGVPGLGLRFTELSSRERRQLERAFGPLVERWETGESSELDLTGRVVAPME